jgi:hypothetical protein
VNEAPANIIIVKKHSDSFMSVISFLNINVDCVGTTSADPGRMGEHGNEAPINAAKNHGHSSVSANFLSTPAINKISQEVDHVGQLSSAINNSQEEVTPHTSGGQPPSVTNNPQEDVATRKSTGTKKNPSILSHNFLW